MRRKEDDHCYTIEPQRSAQVGANGRGWPARDRVKGERRGSRWRQDEAAGMGDSTCSDSGLGEEHSRGGCLYFRACPHVLLSTMDMYTHSWSGLYQGTGVRVNARQSALQLYLFRQVPICTLCQYTCLYGQALFH